MDNDDTSSLLLLLMMMMTMMMLMPMKIAYLKYRLRINRARRCPTVPPRKENQQ